VASAAAPIRLANHLPTRRLLCPDCRHSFDAAKRAMTVRCPRCGAHLHAGDIIASRLPLANLSTLGEVKIVRRGAVRGSVECGSLLVEGELCGEVNVRGRARIEPRARVTGVMRATSLVVASGARMNAHVEIRALAQ
jgi:hypothetical protein